MMLDLLVGICVLVVLTAVMIITKINAKRLTVEGSRKIIHITMGCLTLTFPFVFTYRQSVVYLGIIAIVLLLIIRFNKNLRQSIGSALLNIQRESFGEIYFVISVVIVFVLHESAFEYLIPIAVLTFADSVAALVGSSYGRYNLAHKNEDTKSSEGSVMFFIVAFICALIPLQLMTDIGRAEVLVISFLIGILAAIIEIVCRRGGDNLLLPILTYSILLYNINQTLGSIFFNLAIMSALLILGIVIYKLTGITKISVAYSFLVAYIIMIQGGVAWVVPPLMLFLTFGILPMMKDEEKKLIHTSNVIECNTTIGIIWLVASVFFPVYRETFYFAFALTFACHLAINTYSRLVNYKSTTATFAIICAFLKATVFISLPTLIITRMSPFAFVLHTLFLLLVLPCAMALNKKHNYSYESFNPMRLRAYKVSVGILTTAFAVTLIALGGYYDIL